MEVLHHVGNHHASVIAHLVLRDANSSYALNQLRLKALVTMRRRGGGGLSTVVFDLG